MKLEKIEYSNFNGNQNGTIVQDVKDIDQACLALHIVEFVTDEKMVDPSDFYDEKFPLVFTVTTDTLLISHCSVVESNHSVTTTIRQIRRGKNGL